eukprot:scaffold134581_cov23-Cyclotella_meneghiniana.AAC.1
MEAQGYITVEIQQVRMFVSKIVTVTLTAVMKHVEVSWKNLGLRFMIFQKIAVLTNIAGLTKNFVPQDKTNSKCEDDSVVPAEDLSTALYDSIEDCCLYGLSWLSKGACFSASGMDCEFQGSAKNGFHTFPRKA